MSTEALGPTDLALISAQSQTHDHLSVPALHLHPDGMVVHANRAAQDLANRLSASIEDLLPIHHATYVAEARKQPNHTVTACPSTYASETVLQWSYRAENDAVTMFVADISGLSHLAEHLTETQDRLLQSETLLRRFIEHVPIAVAMFDLNMRYLLCSRKWQETFSFLPDKLIGTNLYDLIPTPELARERHRRALMGETPETTEMAFVRPDTGAEEWLLSHVLPWQRDDGTTGGILIFPEVITTRKIAEEARERHHVLARQQQKMEALGTLAAGIAHEISSPIQYINDNLGFLESATADLFGLIGTYRAAIASAAISESARQRIAEAESRIDLAFLRKECNSAAQQSRCGVETIGRIISAIKTFSNPSENEATPTDINGIVRDALLLSGNRWQPVAEANVDLDDTLPLILAHSDQLGQAILNIVINAAQAIADTDRSERGTISIRTRNRGNHVEVEIADNGVGIPQHHLTRVFDPFFTTRAPGHGTGQGLSIAHAIITRAHGGELHVKSQPGQSTRFTVILPYETI